MINQINNNLYSKFDYQKTINVKSNNSVIKNENPKKNNFKKYALLTAAIASVAIGAILISKNKKQANIESPKLRKQTETITFKSEEVLSNHPFIQRIADDFNSSKNFETFNNIDTSLQELINLSAIEKSNRTFEGFNFPNQIYFSKVNSKTFPDFINILSNAIDINCTQYKYNGDLETFLSLIDDYSKKPFDRRMFLNIQNLNEFLSDVESSTDKNRNIFLSAIENIKKNKITLTTNSMFSDYLSKTGLNSYKCSFEPIEKTLDKDIDFYDSINCSGDLEKLWNKLNAYISPYNLLELKGENIIIKGNEENIDRVLSQVFADLEMNLSKIDAEKSSLTEIEQKLQQLEKRFAITENMPEYLYLENFDKQSNIKFEDIEEVFSKYKTKMIIKSDETKIKPNNAYQFTCTDNIDRVLGEYLKLSHKARFLDFSAIEKSVLKDCLAKLYFFKANNKYKECANFLLFGQEEKSRKLLDSFKKLLEDFHFAKVEFDNKEPEKTFESFVNELKKARELYEKENRYSIIEMDKFDDLLTNHETSKDRRLIARFKNLAEIMNDEYHCVGFLRTQKPLEKFDSASIGTQRFSIVNIKEG